MRRPCCPDFSRFADRFRHDDATPDGNLRAAYFATYKTGATEYLAPEELYGTGFSGAEVVSAGFVTPYPPGFPILVPGQVITANTLDFMAALDTREVHGYDPALGYRVFTESGMPDSDGAGHAAEELQHPSDSEPREPVNARAGGGPPSPASG